MTRTALAWPSLAFPARSSVAGESPLRDSEATVAGASQPQGSRGGWQWAASFEREHRPVADRTGERCAARQQGEVWFLAGTYGTRRTVRTCTVPAGKSLFFPLVDSIVMPWADRLSECDGVTAPARRATDGVSSLVLRVD